MKLEEIKPGLWKVIGWSSKEEVTQKRIMSVKELLDKIRAKEQQK